MQNFQNLSVIGHSFNDLS